MVCEKKVTGGLGDDDFVVMGEIAGAYGVRGEVRVHNYDSLPLELIGIDRWWLNRSGRWQACKAGAVRVHGDCLLAKIDGVDDREAAAALRKTPVALLRSDLPGLGEGSFYWFELTGMAVVNRAGEGLGRVVGLIDSPANDVLRLVDDAGRERLIPMVEAVVDRVDRQTRTIVVDWSADWD